jgi:hypothetical protein
MVDRLTDASRSERPRYRDPALADGILAADDDLASRCRCATSHARRLRRRRDRRPRSAREPRPSVDLVISDVVMPDLTATSFSTAFTRST